MPLPNDEHPFCAICAKSSDVAAMASALDQMKKGPPFPAIPFKPTNNY
jgi:hypothetical protein